MTKPSQDLVRARTDENVLRALMDHRRLTRAELAAVTGISKPTANESVRRLTGLGLVADTGERTPGGRGRGRVGSYYALSDAAGVALAVAIAPDGVTAECVDSYGKVVARIRSEPTPAVPAESDGRPGGGPGAAAAGGSGQQARRAGGAVERRGGAWVRPEGQGVTRVLTRPGRLTRLVQDTAAEALAYAGGPARLAVVSVADPVDRRTGRPVHLPDAPFLVGDLDPVAALTPSVSGPVVVDNDVNWAAQAERHAVGAGLDDFAYVHLGEGLGCAVVSDGQVLRGNAGTAGEIAHLVTAGPDGRAMPFTQVFAALEVRRPGSTAIDVTRLLDGDDRHPALARAVTGVLAAVVALVDPAVIVVGGSWGPALLEPIATEFAGQPRHVPVRAARVADDPSLSGARDRAREMLRAALVEMV